MLHASERGEPLTKEAVSCLNEGSLPPEVDLVSKGYQDWEQAGCIPTAVALAMD
jgi:hypothetical protein